MLLRGWFVARCQFKFTRRDHIFRQRQLIGNRGVAATGAGPIATRRRQPCQCCFGMDKIGQANECLPILALGAIEVALIEI